MTPMDIANVIIAIVNILRGVLKGNDKFVAAAEIHALVVGLADNDAKADTTVAERFSDDEK